MNKLIIDAAKDKIFLMIINNDINYSITHENSKINYEKLSILINDFLNKKKLDLNKVSQIYVNRGPGSFAGIRNSLAVVKAIYVAKKIDYYCFSFDDFDEFYKNNYERLTMLINSFLNSKKMKLNDISSLYVNRGPGSFAGIRNSLSIVKAIHFVKKIDYYCYSFQDFKGEKDIKYENIPDLCDKFNIKKNLINPIYLS